MSISSSVNTAIRGLAEAVAGTNEFMELKKAKVYLKRNQKLDAMMNEFERKQQAMSSPGISQQEAQSLMMELSEDYENMIKIPEIQAYFNTSENFNKMFAEAMQSLHEAIDYNLN